MIKSSCVYPAAGSIFSGICTVEIVKMPIDAGSRWPDLPRLGTLDDSTTTGDSRLVHDGHHPTTTWCDPKSRFPPSGRGVLSGTADVPGKAEQ
jgi:hypothetical protein